MAYNNYGNQNRRNDRYQQEPPKLPKDYLESGYYYVDEQGNLELIPDFIVAYPKTIANALKDRQMNKSSQLRKFYDYCIRIRDMMDQQNRSFTAIEGEFKRLVPFVTYAQTRKRVSQLFVEFITKNVEAVQDEDDFRAFLKHFEAIIAYLPKEQQ